MADYGRETTFASPLLPQIATMRMTVLNFSFAEKLQSKLSPRNVVQRRRRRRRRRSESSFASKPRSGRSLSLPFGSHDIFVAWDFPTLVYPDDSSRVAPVVYRNFGHHFGLASRMHEVCSPGEKGIVDCSEHRYYIQDEFWTTTAPRWIVKNDRLRS